MVTKSIGQGAWPISAVVKLVTFQVYLSDETIQTVQASSDRALLMWPIKRKNEKCPKANLIYTQAYE